MVAAVKYNKWKELTAEGANWGSDQFKVVLSNTAPDVVNDVQLTDLAEIAAGNGYTAGGNNIATVSSGLSGSQEQLVFTDLVITAAGGNIGPFRYIIIHDSTVNCPCQYYDLGSAQTILDGSTGTCNFAATTMTLD